MANLFGYGANNQSVINQLIRQKESIDNMIQQYSQQQQQPPIQNIINTGLPTDFEARILRDDETPENTLVQKKTMILDKKNKRVCVKEVDGSISEKYEIVVLLDEKDQRIMELEKKIKEMEEKENDKCAEFVETNDDKYKSYTDDDGIAQSTTKTNVKSISKSTK